MPQTEQVDCLDSKHLKIFAGCDHCERLLCKNNQKKIKKTQHLCYKNKHYFQGKSRLFDREVGYVALAFGELTYSSHSP